MNDQQPAKEAPYAVSMTEHESWERFEEGLKRAASKAKELGLVQKSEIWTDIALLITEIRQSGKVLYEMKPLSEKEISLELERAKHNIIVN